MYLKIIYTDLEYGITIYQYFKGFLYFSHKKEWKLNTIFILSN